MGILLATNFFISGFSGIYTLASSLGSVLDFNVPALTTDFDLVFSFTFETVISFESSVKLDRSFYPFIVVDG